MTTVVSSILEVFSALVAWFTETIGDVGAIFYVAETGLTFVGTITIIGVAIAVTLMVIAMIRSLLRLQ
ncbi:MAG: hypothetical protein IJX97_00530 [Clostridia bacterium]|nr:hypothetical protein [Clostridia bacterium]